MDNRIRKIVVGGVFSALVIVLGIPPGLGFIHLPLASITILQVPVIIAAILEGPLVGFFTGLLFGIFSLVTAATAGTTAFDTAFLNYPWVAIVPRILIGPGAWLVYSLASGAFFGKAKGSSTEIETAGKSTDLRETGVLKENRFLKETLAIILGAVVGSLVNTVLVLSSFVLILPEIIAWPTVFTVASLNGTIEAGFSAAISLAVILPWKGISRRQKSKLTRSV
ncbi:MAG: ECF transporter S component [Treponema sp.]|nr:ECF transporter S component [Treponema sp.]